MEGSHLLPVELGKAGVQPRRRRLARGVELGTELLLPTFERQELVLEGPCRHALGDGVDHPSQSALDLGQLGDKPVALRALAALQAVQLAGELGAELAEQLRVSLRGVGSV